MADELIRLIRNDPYPAGFTQVDNRDIWTRPDLSGSLVFRPVTLGVFVAMWSLPCDWVFYESWLIEHLGVGRQRLQRSLVELKEAGRLTQDKIRDEESGRFVGTKWELYRAAQGGSPQIEKPQSGEPSPGAPSSGQPQLPSTERAPNTDPTITEASAHLRLTTILGPDQKAIVGGILAGSGLTAEAQQMIADELGYAMAQPRGVAKPAAYTAKLVERARKGQYNPDGALVVAGQRRNAEAAEQQRRREIEQRRQSEARLAAERSDPATRARIATLIAQTEKSLRTSSNPDNAHDLN